MTWRLADLGSTDPIVPLRRRLAALARERGSPPCFRVRFRRARDPTGGLLEAAPPARVAPHYVCTYVLTVRGDVLEAVYEAAP